LQDLINGHAQIFFPLFFVTMWFAITTILSVLSGWYVLMRKYPDRNETPVLRLRFQSGSMGVGVHMRGLLRLDVCPSGLRVGILRIFGVFNRDFFVPWSEIRIERKDRYFWKLARLRLGNVGNLTIFAHVADRLARSLPGRWPEQGAFPEETKKQAGASVLKMWALATCLAALFFIIAPRMGSSNGVYPPIAVAILFPALVFGLVALVSYFVRLRR